ncbi:RNA polymerase sigma factor [Sphingosinicella xenopeptidilytica]|uniref:RNA polymerase sigma factor n=1 Tax=Sphingosinicella xenopeptidilytica TaxID=364098 RepID=A0ABW3C3H0_SPHXN
MADSNDSAGPEQPARQQPPRWLISLYHEQSAALCRYLRRKYGAGPPEPEDVMHEAFSRLAALPDETIAIIENPRAFLYRTAENLLNSERRKRAVRSAHAAETKYLEKTSSECTPERVILARDQLNIAEAVLREMPDMRRRCFLMHRFDDLSFSEIGRRLGMTPNGAKGHVMRAMTEIVSALEASSRRSGIKPE